MGWHLITGQEAGAWVAQQINGSFSPDSCEAIAVARDGVIQAGVMYDQWNKRSIMAHIAVSGRMTPAFLAAIFDYPFNECGVTKVICPITSDNARSIRLCKHMGFTQEARIKDAAPTGDVLLFTLTKSACRFLKDRYGKKCAKAAART